MRQDRAEYIAAQALEWIASDADLLGVFMGATGAGADDMRERAGQPAFLASVLDFVLLDDAWVTGFCDARALAYETPFEARRALPGGSDPNWT